MPEVSVVMTAFDAVHALSAAVASVLAQTFQDFEILVVGDRACAALADHRRVTTIPDATGSREHARNIGITWARGDLIAFLDAGAHWLREKLELQVEYFHRFPLTVFLHGPAMRGAPTTTAIADLALQDRFKPPTRDGFAAIARRDVDVRAATVMARRRALLDLGGFAPASRDDAERHLWLRMAARHDTGYLAVPLAVEGAAPHSGRGRATTAGSSIGAATSGSHQPAATTARPRNLVHDTMFGRARSAASRLAHRADDVLSHVGRTRRRLLFEAATPMSVSVFRPIYERLRRDDRLELWFTTCDTRWDAAQTFGAVGISERVLTAREARWRKFDAYINADFWNMTWLPRHTRRLHLFHGVAGKYDLDAPADIAPVVATFDRLLFPNRDRLERYAEAGLIDRDGRQGVLVGYPKVDCLVDGSLDRAAIRACLGLDPSRPTVLYAPTWSPYSSLNSMGDAIVAALAKMDANVIVKLHDRSALADARGSGGIDWRARLADVRGRRDIHVATDPDASPYLFVADALVTDHSSVGFEFMLLDRPVVVVDCPALLEKARVNPEKVALLRGASDVVADAGDVPATIRRGLEHPTRLSAERRAAARDLFYQPGSATARATAAVYELIDLAAPEPLPDARPSPAPALTNPQQGSLKCAL